jgi:hypothetical protein
MRAITARSSISASCFPMHPYTPAIHSVYVSSDYGATNQKRKAQRQICSGITLASHPTAQEWILRHISKMIRPWASSARSN